MPRAANTAQALLHLGFHKTGTSSAQHFLSNNRHALAPHLQILLISALIPAEKYARRFSKTRSAGDLIGFTSAFHACLTRFAPDPSRPLLLSCEGLAGDIPGRAGVMDYGALSELAPAIVEVIASAGYAKPRIQLCFSLRQPGTWLRSAYFHNLRSTRLTLDFNDYTEAYKASADLAGMVKTISAACPGQPVSTCWLEQTRVLPLGPVTPLLDHFVLPEPLLASLAPPDAVNPGIDAAFADRLLALNRGPLPRDQLKAAKAALISTLKPAAALRTGGMPRGTEKPGTEI